MFLVVDYEDNVANLYLSDVTGQFYVTAMENVVGLRYPGKFSVDIVKVCKASKCQIDSFVSCDAYF